MDRELAANIPLSHYRIVSKIGAGGMGEVYLAQDTRLDRKVETKNNLNKNDVRNGLYSAAKFGLK